LEYRDLSVCLSHGAAAYAIGTLAACSLDTAGNQRCADCGPILGPDGHSSAAIFGLNCYRPGGGAYLAARGVIRCYNWFAGTDLFVYGFPQDVGDEKIKKFFAKKGVSVAHVKRIKGKQ